jgi:SAM-dependent methyltransferase
VETEPIPTGELFDVVVCSEVLEHLHDWHAGIAHLSGALRPGGRLVVSVPHSMRWWSQVDEAVGHLRRYEKAELSSGFRAGGLLPERVFTWGGPLYHLHRKLLTGRVKLDHTWKHPNWVVVALQKVLYAALFLDDVFVGARIGRFLYGVARRPEPGHPGSALQRRP